MRLKQVVRTLASVYSDSLQIGIELKQVYKTVHYWSRDMLNFVFLEKDPGIISPSYFMNDFSRKMFLMLHSINWPNFIAWLSLLPEAMANFLGCDVRNFKINLVFVMDPFL